jgi:hypothetical protein
MRPLLPVFAVAAGLALAACGGNATAPQSTPVGNYVLVTVNGKPLPQLVARTASGDLEVVSATLVLRGDQTYTTSYLYRPVASPANTISQTAAGTWRVSGATVTTLPDGSSPSSVNTMRWEDPTLTLVDATAAVPATLVFRK